MLKLTYALTTYPLVLAACALDALHAKYVHAYLCIVLLVVSLFAGLLAGHSLQVYQEPVYTFHHFYNDLPQHSKDIIPYCELPVDTSLDTIDTCANTGKFPDRNQSMLWELYPTAQLCVQFKQQYACKAMAN